MRFSLPIALLLLAGCTATAPSAPRSALQTAVVPPLHAESFGLTRARDVRTLVIVIHANGAPGTRPDEIAFAQSAATAIPRSAVVALLRPGQQDSKGHVSPGDAGTGHGDDFAPWHIGRVETAILAEQRRYPQARTILVGDGEGAAIAANLAGLRPDMIDAMVLVGCPCALPEWRTHMAQRTRKAEWRAPVASLDPLKSAGGIRAGLRAAVLVGANDTTTPVKLSRAYAEALALRGIATDFRIVPGKGHDLLGDAETLSALTRIAAAFPEKR
jgi:pimeloyl-ACP methyl ester carboxylesterase